MTPKNARSEKKKARTDAQDDRDELVLRPEKPCCCPPRVLVWGSTSSQTVAVTNKMFEDEELKVRADANASIQPPSGPNVNADGSGGSELRTRLRRDVDLVESTTTYAFEWRMESACPVAVAVSIFGEVQARIPCAPDAGSSALSRRRLLEAGEVNSAPRGTATAVVVAVDCHGHEVRCQVELTEP